MIGKHERLVHNLTPKGYGSKNYTTDVVKRLAMFYQAMDESRDVVSMKPKPTLAQGLSKELLTAYQPKDTILRANLASRTKMVKAWGNHRNLTEKSALKEIKGRGYW